MSNKTTIITPTISANNKHNFNILMNDDQKITTTVCVNNDKYVIITHGDSTNSITIDDETLELLFQARYKKNIITRIIDVIKNTSAVSNKILNNINLLAKLTAEIKSEIVLDDAIIDLIKNTPEAAKYITKYQSE